MGSDPESSCSQYSCLRIYGFLSPDSSHTKPRLFTMFFIISLELFIISLWGLTPVLVMGSDPTVQYKVVAVFLLASKQMPVYSLYSFHRTFIPGFEYLTPSGSNFRVPDPTVLVLLIPVFHKSLSDKHYSTTFCRPCHFLFFRGP